jgi:MFS family permease
MGLRRLIHFAATRLTDRPAGSSTGAVLSGGFAGPVIAPTLVGFLAQHVSYSLAWLTLAVMLAGATLCMLILPATKARPARREPPAGTG